MMIKKALRYIAAIAALSVVVILIFSEEEPKENFSPRDYDEIVSSGTLRAVTVYNAVSLHVKEDTMAGFDYELLNEFTKEKNLKLEITPATSFGQRFDGITEGRYDLLAAPTALTSQLKDTLNFTHPILLSKQVLVQRKKADDTDSLYITNLLDLANKNIHVIKESPAIVRMHNLMMEIGDTIFIHEVERYGSEQLLAMVSAGDIDYAVCEDNIAQASMKDFPNLDIQTDISFTQFYSWGVNKQSVALLDSLNTWLDDYLKSKEYKKLYKKYFQ